MTHDSEAVLPLLPLRLGLVLPGSITPLPVGRTRSIALARTLRPGDTIVLAAQKDPAIDDPRRDDLYSIGVRAVVREKADRGKRGLMLVVEATDRIFLGAIAAHEPYLRAEVMPCVETRGLDAEAVALSDVLRAGIGEILSSTRPVQGPIDEKCPPGLVADRIAAALDVTTDQRREILEALDVVERLRRLSKLMSEARARSAIKEHIQKEVQREMNDEQREAVLRKQLRAIQRELGDAPDEQSELRTRLDEADLPPDARKVADRELARLEAMNPAQAEAQVARSFLEVLADLPWSKRAEVNDDIQVVADALDADHHGLEDVKRRILEHMAVLKLAPHSRGTLLCLAGPPGVGKTSLAQSVASATGRPLVRVSLGGVRDEAEIRGHRRTYVGSMPGRIIAAVRKVGVKNPVIVLDEVDKVVRGTHGDPDAALLEVLDPEQNDSFTDHYVEVPFDLSEVLFIATANDVQGLSAPLRDRLEIIEISGYTPEEKRMIARRHLVQKQLERHGLDPLKVRVSDETIEVLIERYTREAGVRQLQREVAKIARAIALDAVKTGAAQERMIEPADLRALSGRPRFQRDDAEMFEKPGVAAGLAWTPVGGDVLFVETTRMPGKGRVEITGQLGDVMKESVRTALSFLRSNAHHLGIDLARLEEEDLHVHVPAGAIPKDGPSAGVTMLTALASLLSGRKVRSDVAMTGEATLRGRVLAVGGIKSKVLAAHRAGYRTVILPHQNEVDLDDVPETVRESLHVVFAKEMLDVLSVALEPPASEPTPRITRDGALVAA
jgi:ATP-dependent Lon protease